MLFGLFKAIHEPGNGYSLHLILSGSYDYIHGELQSRVTSDSIVRDYSDYCTLSDRFIPDGIVCNGDGDIEYNMFRIPYGLGDQVTNTDGDMDYIVNDIVYDKFGGGKISLSIVGGCNPGSKLSFNMYSSVNGRWEGKLNFLLNKRYHRNRQLGELLS